MTARHQSRINGNKTKQRFSIDQVTTHLRRKAIVVYKRCRPPWGVKITKQKAFSKLGSLLRWLSRKIFTGYKNKTRGTMTLYFSWKETFCWDFHMENQLYRLTDPRKLGKLKPDYHQQVISKFHIQVQKLSSCSFCKQLRFLSSTTRSHFAVITLWLAS